MDTARRRIPTNLHTGALTGLRGGPDRIPGPGLMTEAESKNHDSSVYPFSVPNNCRK